MQFDKVKMMKKSSALCLIFLLLSLSGTLPHFQIAAHTREQPQNHVQPLVQPRAQFNNQNLIFAKDMTPDLKPNPWSLTIYRPENSFHINEIHCWVKFTDADTGEDVTYTKIFPKYSWVNRPDKNLDYHGSYYLSGGMLMKIILKPGRYNITVYTPKDKVFGITTPNKGDWTSNVFYYDTNNPTNVIWVVPVADEYGFYTGSWYIDYRAPKYYKFTKPRIN
ncbi:hypothetical protein [Treponema sp.]|uniref:hypothetical protein n=1 Tax=Treponema sp. TaxID=166 RepID=UPI00298EA3FE|nr:hypothetical protein [Treponema sp.]MCR5612845.1 hypothetical protein [Treponema sp.]